MIKPVVSKRTKYNYFYFISRVASTFFHIKLTQTSTGVGTDMEEDGINFSCKSAQR